jgi:DUF1680 family protein
MLRSTKTSRRVFLKSASLTTFAAVTPGRWLFPKATPPPGLRPLEQFDYGDVNLESGLHEQQLEETHSVLMGLNEDSLLKPFRQMSGQAAPGEDLGGWYTYNPDFDWRKGGDGFAPSCTFGQWVSALARMYAIRRDPATRDKVLRLNRLYAQTIAGDYYDKNRFPAYCYDKIVCGLIDSHQYVGDPDAFAILDRTTDTALPHFPEHAVEHDAVWRHDKDESWSWDESYTLPENLFLAYQRGAGGRYRELAQQYLDDHYYDPLADDRNVLGGRHAYSYVNCLSSAVQAYLTLGNEKYLRTARNAFSMLLQQSFATGGWGPDEQLRAPDSPDVYNSLTRSHSSFETPCGSYAHFKLTRYLLRITGESRYGDSMERVMYNTVLGAKPLMPDGRTFYYSDYNFKGRKVYSPDQHWACCSGTLPQVAADYRINTYFRDPNGLWVNLYIPSSVRWRHHKADIVVQQRSSYPFEEFVQLEVKTSKAAHFNLRLRIPEWSKGASIAINGRRVQSPDSGTFAVIERKWKDGDRIELELPMTTRLEPLDAHHQKTVALLYGPLVLFAISENEISPTASDLLGVIRAGQRTWELRTTTTAEKMIPFTEIRDDQYTTYFNLI